MHRDHKLALALALLLIGIAAALCFPRQQQTGLADLELENADQLDAAIDLLPVRVYTEPRDQSAESEEPADEQEPADSNPELQDPFLEFALLPAAPDPIPLADVSRPAGARANESPTPASETIRVEVRPPGGTAPAESGGAALRIPEDDEPDAPLIYEVRPGDTLSGLAGRFLGSTRRFLDLYDANRDVLSSPDDLQVGMRLTIPRAGTTAGGDDVRVAHTPPTITDSERTVDSGDDGSPASTTRETSGQPGFRPVRTPFSRRFGSHDPAP